VLETTDVSDLLEVMASYLSFLQTYPDFNGEIWDLPSGAAFSPSDNLKLRAQSTSIPGERYWPPENYARILPPVRLLMHCPPSILCGGWTPQIMEAVLKMLMPGGR